MAKIDFPEGFVADVKRWIPGNSELMKALEEGDSATVGELLKNEWQTNMPDFFTKVISRLERGTCFDAVTLLKNKRAVVKLYERWYVQWGKVVLSET